jgi:lipoate-protein ligase A
MAVCRLLPYAVDDGPANMAADEALLESAAAGVASLRFYGWCPPTLSLGYFQPERLRGTDERLAGLPYVRRPTGGDALVHHHELTYALGLPAGAPWQGLGNPWLCRMHAVIAAALEALGVHASQATCHGERRHAGVLCFQHLTPGDLVIGPAKVVGSAQRRQKGALLQHGGILLAASPHTPALPGIGELGGVAVDADELATAVRDELVRQTGWQLEPADWTAAERRRKEELVRTKYTQERWNCKR